MQNKVIYKDAEYKSNNQTTISSTIFHPEKGKSESIKMF